MEDFKFAWNASMDSNATELRDNSLLISGELVNASICTNNFAIDKDEFPKIVKQIPTATLRLDHSKSARDVIGGLTKGEYDEANKRIMFEAEVDDPHIQKLINKGRLKYVSIGATADAFCSACGVRSKPVKTCKCKDSHDIIKNIKLKEVSIITDPAYPTAEFKPMGFIAGINSALAEYTSNTVMPDSSSEGGVTNLKNMEEKKEMSAKEEEVKATTLKPAGSDSVVLLGEKLEGFIKRFEKMESKFKKLEDDEEAKKKSEEAKKKSDDEACKLKKEEETFTKLEQTINALSTKLDEALKVKKAQPPEEETEEEEDEAKKKKRDETKKEAPAPIVKGARVEDAGAVTADAKMTWWEEIRAEAKKRGILDY